MKGAFSGTTMLFLMPNKVLDMRHLIPIFLLSLFMIGCSTTNKVTEERTGYQQISRDELKEILESSVDVSNREKGTYEPRWFYVGSDDHYHYLFFFYPTYLHFNLPPPSNAHFYKIRRVDLNVGSVRPYNPDLSRAREIFRKPSNFSKLSIEEQHRQRVEKGDVPDTASYDYSIDYVNM